MPKRIEAWEDGYGGIHRTEREAMLAHASFDLRNFVEASIGSRGTIETEELLHLLKKDAEEWTRLTANYVRAKQTKEEASRFPPFPQCLMGEKEEVLSLSRTPRKP